MVDIPGKGKGAIAARDIKVFIDFDFSGLSLVNEDAHSKENLSFAKGRYSPSLELVSPSFARSSNTAVNTCFFF